MVIASYQIQNVLKVYSRQLKQSRLFDKQNGQSNRSSTDKISISLEGKRQAIIDKVASDVVDRITKFGPQNEVEHNIVDKLEEETGQKFDFKSQNSDEFVFNFIDNNNEKKTTSLSMENSGMIIKRLEELTKEAVDTNMDYKKNMEAQNENK